MATTMPVSQKPWSDYTAADYTIEQWHNACLIHNHKGPPISKSQCKLPVKTPNGTVNKNGVFAAAGAIAGARGGVRAGLDQKKAAVRTLLSLYSKMGEKPPDSLANFIHTSMIIGKDFIAHHGVRGQKWGIRNKRTRQTLVPSSPEHRTAQRLKARPRHSLTNQELRTLTDRQTLEQRHAQLNPTKVQKGAKKAKAILGAAGTVASVYALAKSPAGKAAMSLGKKALGKHGVK